MIQNGGNIVRHQKVEDTEATKWINYGNSGEGLYEVLLWCERGLVTKQEQINCVPEDGWADEDVTRRFKTEKEADFFVDVVLNLKKMMNIQLNHLEMHKFESYEDIKENFYKADAIIFPSNFAAEIYFQEIHNNEIKAIFFGISKRIINCINSLGHDAHMIDYFSGNLEKSVTKTITSL